MKNQVGKDMRWDEKARSRVKQRTEVEKQAVVVRRIKQRGKSRGCGDGSELVRIHGLFTTPRLVRAGMVDERFRQTEQDQRIGQINKDKPVSGSIAGSVSVCCYF